MKKKFIILFVAIFAQAVCAQQKGTGLLPLSLEEEQLINQARQEFLGAGDLLYSKLLSSYANVDAKSFDLREINGITAIKDQFDCGSCWAFSTLASLESSSLLINKKTLDLSEQQLVNCISQSQGCNGGYPEATLQELVGADKGVLSEKELPYLNRQGNCFAGQGSPVKISNWGQLDKNASIRDIKNALVNHGALIGALNAGTDAFLNHGPQSGVIQDDNIGRVSHAVTIAGWDDNKQAWLIKNSWGEKWGDKGYGWVKYGKQDLSRISWVDVRRLDESYVAPTFTDADQYELSVTSVLGSIQEYQNIVISVDSGKKVFKYGMNRKNVKYNNKLKLTPGTHRIEIITYSIISKKGKKASLFGLGVINVVMDGDKSFKISYGKRVKDPNIFSLKIKEEDR